MHATWPPHLHGHSLTAYAYADRWKRQEVERQLHHAHDRKLAAVAAVNRILINVYVHGFGFVFDFFVTVPHSCCEHWLWYYWANWICRSLDVVKVVTWVCKLACHKICRQNETIDTQWRSLFTRYYFAFFQPRLRCHTDGTVPSSVHRRKNQLTT